MHRLCSSLAIFALASAAAGCSDDPVNYSAPVGINLKAKSSDTVNSVVSDDKGITTESGNPYGAFVSDAKRTLGHDPSAITVERVELLLGARSTGVTRLGEIFNGDVDVLFQMNDTDNSFPVARQSLGSATGGGPVPLGVVFNSDALGDADYTKLLGGGFKVIIRGAAAPEFMDKGADADLQITFTFAAFE
jgi:hypothetical protein